MRMLACLSLAASVPCQSPQTWQQLARPCARAGPSLAFDTTRGKCVLFGGDGGFVLDDTWEGDGQTWYQRNPTVRPPARNGAAMCYDAARRRTVLFGGGGGVGAFVPLGDTWEWDGTQWAQAQPALSPAPRAECGMVYDSVRQRCVLVGGTDNAGAFGDTWTWDGQSWTQVAMGGGPGTRQGPAMAFDAQRGVTVLVGGVRPSSHYLRDVWEFDGVSWTRRTDAPSPVMNANLVPNPIGPGVLLFGGRVQLGTPICFDQAWRWDGAAWTQLATAVDAVNRAYAGAATDPLRRRIVLFGGIRVQQAQEVYQDDTWTGDGARWALTTDGRSPGGRRAHGYAYDERRDRIVLFGGGKSDSMDDCWEWDGWAWNERVVTPRPVARSHMGMVYDAARGRTVVVGGYHYPTNSSILDTWEWDGTRWYNRTPPSQPPATATPRSVCTYARGPQRTYLLSGASLFSWDGTAWTQLPSLGVSRFMAGMAYDENRGRLVVFGGRQSPPPYTPLQDTWEFDGGSWSQGPPGPLFFYAGTNNMEATVTRLVYDPARARIVALGFSGVFVGPASQMQVWEYDGQWQSAGVGPTARNDYGMVYDTARQRAVVYGGERPGNPNSLEMFGDTWALSSADLAVAQREVQPGGIVQLQLRGPIGPVPHFYLTGLSQTTGPSILLPVAGRSPFGAWPLAADRLFALTLGMPALLGVFSPQGVGNVSIPLPPDPALDGFRFFASALTYDVTLTVTGISREAEIVILR